MNEIDEKTLNDVLLFRGNITFEKIQSAYCADFQNDSELLNEVSAFSSKVQQKDFYISMLKIWNIYTCRIDDYLSIQTDYWFSKMAPAARIHWWYPFINDLYRWHDKRGRMTFQEISSGILLFTQTVNFHIHSVKSVRIWSYSNPFFPAFSPNVGKYGPE